MDINEVAWRAAGALERLHSLPYDDVVSDNLDNPTSHPNANDGLISEWRRLATAGDERRFRRRFLWDQLDYQQVLSLFSLPATTLKTDLPTWTLILQETIEVAPTCADADVPENARIPFQEVLSPFRIVAQRRLRTLCPLYDSLSTNVQEELESELMNRLSHLAGQTLYLEFSLARQRERFEGNPLRLTTSADDNKRLYRSFTAGLLQNGFARFFDEYAVLGRLLAQTVEFWIETSQEFIQRLVEDQSEIAQHFGFPADLTKLDHVTIGISDLHNRGRTVHVATFTGGHRVVYKPKCLKLDAAFYKFIEWVNDLSALPNLRVLRTLPRDGYGWTEFLEWQPLPDTKAAHRFYLRAGMLLCLMYVLGESDCHFENLIAAGERPVLIDVETLMHPWVPVSEAGRARTSQEGMACDELLRDSVLRTGLLPGIPYLNVDPDFDSSGLMGDSGQQTLFLKFEWRNLNTDDMEMAGELSETLPKANLPKLDDLKLSPADYEQELVQGFSEMYRMLREHADVLTTEHSSLGAIAKETARFIFRSSRFYSYVLARSLHPKFLRDGLERFVQLEVLSAALLRFNRKPRSWQLLRHEIEALDRFDIPKFQVSPNSDCVQIDRKTAVTELFSETGFERVCTRLAALSDRDLEVQAALIRKAIHTQPDQRRRFRADVNKRKQLQQDGEGPPDAASVIRRIVNKLAAEAITLPSGGVTWLTPLELPIADPFRLGPVGYNLYDGACGIALFLAAAHKTSGCGDSLALCRDALAPLRRTLEKRDQDNALRELLGIGGAFGLGSIVYSLVVISDLLDEPELVEDAAKAAALITNEVVQNDSKLDVVGGSAGAILGLLALTNKYPAFLENAVICGDHLLARRSRESGWPTYQGRCLTGFAHGAAGISAALFRLWQVTGLERFRTGAYDGLTFEQSMFNAQAGNWRDLRFEEPAYTVSWCHGAPGIGLSRMAFTQSDVAPKASRDIEAAIKATLAAGLHPLDQVCCGNFGRIEFLLEARQPESAKQLALRVLQRLDGPLSLRLFKDLPASVDAPSFFAGLAGVGYTLLRLDDPARLPCVLRWESRS